MYQKIIDHMDQNKIRIWNDIYPGAFFEDDIKNKNLYLLTGNDDQNDIIAAFALCESNDGEDGRSSLAADARILEPGRTRAAPGS